MILEPVGGEWRGMVLLLHGLNLKPTHMLPLAEELRHMGMGVINGALTGHGHHYRKVEGVAAADARLATYRTVTLERWLVDVDALYATAAATAEQQGVPLFLVGYSTGALMACTAWAATRTNGFARMVLFAPALAIHLYCHIPLLFRRWPQLLFRSFAPPVYRANRATPVAAYLAVHAAQMCFREEADQRLNVPTQIFIGPRDELISRRGLRRIIREYALTKWQIDVVSKREAEPDAAFHHLIINKAGVGQAEWARMMTKIRQTLLGNSTTESDKAYACNYRECQGTKATDGAGGYHPPDH